jgi:hypothetical protein
MMMPEDFMVEAPWYKMNSAWIEETRSSWVWPLSGMPSGECP